MPGYGVVIVASLDGTYTFYLSFLSKRWIRVMCGILYTYIVVVVIGLGDPFFSFLSAAFAPSQQRQQSSSLTAITAWKDDTVVGITAPMGYFDPLGLSKNKSDAIMAGYRESELKHGRVAMAACLGWYLDAAGVHPAFNSELSNNPLEAAQQLPAVGWAQFVLGCGAIEWLAEKIKERPGYKAGDLLGAAYWVDDSDEGWVDYQNKEINNGRLAMVAFMGIFVQDLYFGEYGDLIHNGSANLKVF
jgi:light-harvesting complex I chlorophyll a/b binding protein 4